MTRRKTRSHLTARQSTVEEDDGYYYDEDEYADADDGLRTSPADALRALVPGVTPAALVEMDRDPAAIRGFSRVQLFLTIHALAQLRDTGKLTPAALSTFMAELGRIVRAEPDADRQGAGQSLRLNINILGGKGHPGEKLVIDGSARQIGGA